MLRAQNAVPITVGDVSDLFLAGRRARALIQRTVIVL